MLLEKNPTHDSCDVSRSVISVIQTITSLRGKLNSQAVNQSNQPHIKLEKTTTGVLGHPLSNEQMRSAY